MILPMYATLCRLPYYRQAVEEEVSAATIYADYGVDSITHKEYWRITTATGLVLSNITDVQRHAMWDYLRDPYTGELWQTLRPEWDVEGLCVCWDERYYDCNLIDHAATAEWRPVEHEPDGTHFLKNLQACVAFALAHHGYIMMREIDSDGVTHYVYYNRIKHMTEAAILLRSGGSLCCITTSSTPTRW